MYPCIFQEVKTNPSNYDAWFDYLRLMESEAEPDAVREVYERAIANVPPAEEKRLWRRYIYLWINYALYEELIAKVNMDHESQSLFFLSLSCRTRQTRNARDWRREMKEARNTRDTFFFLRCHPRFLRLAGSPLDALPSLNLKKKRDCSQSKVGRKLDFYL